MKFHNILATVLIAGLALGVVYAQTSYQTPISDGILQTVLDGGGFSITNLATSTNTSDAATVGYVKTNSMFVAEVPTVTGDSYVNVAITGLTNAPTFVGPTLRKVSPSDPDIFPVSVQDVTSTNVRVNLSSAAPSTNYFVQVAVGNSQPIVTGSYQPLTSTLSSIAAGIPIPGIDTSSAAPASATDTGTKGEVRQVGNYFYICVATDTWVRTPVTTF